MPVKQNMASGCETKAGDSSGNADPLLSFSSDKSGTEASNGTTQCNTGDVLHDKKWAFRPPPRGLTPNEYMLCHR